MRHLPPLFQVIFVKFASDHIKENVDLLINLKRIYKNTRKKETSLEPDIDMFIVI